MRSTEVDFGSDVKARVAGIVDANDVSVARHHAYAMQNDETPL